VRKKVLPSPTPLPPPPGPGQHIDFVSPPTVHTAARLHAPELSNGCGSGRSREKEARKPRPARLDDARAGGVRRRRGGRARRRAHSRTLLSRSLELLLDAELVAVAARLLAAVRRTGREARVAPGEREGEGGVGWGGGSRVSHRTETRRATQPLAQQHTPMLCELPKKKKSRV
jgi:hypothetical protein